MASFVYLLLATDNSTYIGATIDLDRRLRQHNKEIKGGAIATGTKVQKGEIWIRAAYVEGFPDWQAALQFEWRWKQLSRKITRDIKPLQRRIIALKQLLSLEKPTTKSKKYIEWEHPPKVIFQDNETQLYFNSI